MTSKYLFMVAHLQPFKRSFLLAAVGPALALGGCSSAKKKDAPVLSDLEGKKVALVEVLDGEATSRSVVEVALVNQLVKRGTFILVGKKEVDQARALAEVDPTDYQAIARKAGADLALRARVVDWSAVQLEGYSSVVEHDSQLEAERGEDDAMAERLYKVLSLQGKVGIELEFTDLISGEIRKGLAQEEEEVKAEAKSAAAHLPPRLRFLETLANRAFAKFFKEYD